MKKFLISIILILSLCGCSNSADIESNAAAANVAVNGAKIGMIPLVNKCGYEMKESDPSEPVKKNMPINCLPSKTEQVLEGRLFQEVEPGVYVPIDSDDSDRENSGDPKLLLLEEEGALD